MKIILLQFTLHIKQIKLGFVGSKGHNKLLLLRYIILHYSPPVHHSEIKKLLDIQIETTRQILKPAKVTDCFS